jgi:DNA invertase Pin-like site-specific DNA recombinase
MIGSRGVPCSTSVSAEMGRPRRTSTCIRAVASQRGWMVTNVYKDNGFSGAKGRDRRPGLAALLKDASRARFDVVMAWALDRLGRSVRNPMDTLRDLESASVDLFPHQ